MQRDISYSEVMQLEADFNRQCADRHIVFNDEEIEQQALCDFIDQYINGDDEPFVRI